MINIEIYKKIFYSVNILLQCLGGGIIEFIRNKEYIAEFNCLVQSYYEDMIMIAKGVLMDRDLSEEAVQISLIKISQKKVFSRMKRIQESCRKKYILSIVKNTSIDIYRERVNNKSIYISDNNERIIEYKENSDCIDRLFMRLEIYDILARIEKLPIKYRHILEMRALHGRDMCEIAEIYGVSETTARKRLSRARGCLRKSI